MNIKPFGDWPTPTPAECVRSCIDNAEKAARDMARSRQLLHALPHGDVGIPQFRLDLNRHASDQKHWREVATFWRAKVPTPQDTRLPREPGDDTEELAF